jgi:F1F0 ATPase subunit 2
MKLDSGARFGTRVLLGVIFFGGLWWTVRKGLSSKRPASLALR